MSVHDHSAETHSYPKVARASRETDVAPERLWREIASIGGINGWYYQNWLWSLRGALDRLIGGVGMRGRRDPVNIEPGDVVDFMRVVRVEPQRRLVLCPEMRMPGLGALHIALSPLHPGLTRVTVTGSFKPAGLLGHLYWHALLPIHAALFAGMVRAIVRRAAESA